MPPHNTAAWSLRPKTRPLVVSSAPYTSPPAGHVVIKVHSVAINPIDWILQDQDLFRLTYPAILGSDVAGEVVEVGEGVEGLRVGGRAIAHANGTSTSQPTHGAFQQYALVPALTTSLIPTTLPLNSASVLPLSLTTASCGLYLPHHLSLPWPKPSATPKPLHRTLIIWGGASSIGSSATQLAVASGADVLVTASARNSDYCRRLGAREVFDYHDDNVEDALFSSLKSRTLAGIFHAAGDEAAVRACARVAERSEGKAIVVSVRPVPENGIPGSVRVRAISSSEVFKSKEGEEVARRVWGEFVPGALESGRLVAAPEARVVGRGLRSVQRGLDAQKKGVSAAKVVVEGIEGDASKEGGEE